MQNSKATILGNFDTLRGDVGIAIRNTLEGLGIETARLDTTPGQIAASPFDSLVSTILSSDFVIADISKLNPNLSYELGLSHGMRKPTILIKSQESSEEIPSELAGYFCLIYDPHNLGSFGKRLRNSAARFAALSNA